MKKCQILLLHGWGKYSSALDYYHKTVSEFQKNGYTVFVPDMPGFGNEKIPDHPFTLQNYAFFLQTYIQKKKLQDFVIIGHSFGGRVAIKYINRYTEGVRALILCGTPGFTPVSKLKLIISLFLAKIGGFIFSLPIISSQKEKIRGGFYYLVGARDYYRAEGSMRQTFKNIVREELKDIMKKIHIPTLLLWGEDDIIVPVKIAQKMKETIRQSRLTIIPHGKHSVIIDNPKTFVK